LGLVGVTSVLGILYRIVYVFSADSPGPEGATLYSLALWALGGLDQAFVLPQQRIQTFWVARLCAGETTRVRFEH